MSVQGRVISAVLVSSVLIGGKLNRCFDALVILSMCRVQVINLLNSLNRLVLLSGALFGSSLFGGSIFTLCNNLSESVRRRTLRQLLSRLHGDGNHRLLRMHRNVTGRHLRYSGLLRRYRLFRHHGLLGISNILGTLRACRLLSFTFSSFTFGCFTLSSLTCCRFFSLTLRTFLGALSTLLTILCKTLTILRKTLTG